MDEISVKYPIDGYILSNFGFFGYINDISMIYTDILNLIRIPFFPC